MTDTSASALRKLNRLSSYSYSELIECAEGRVFGPGNGRLPLPPMLMFDRIDEVLESGGKLGAGLVRTSLLIRPDQWFFQCHFKDDPVMPGCLGLDALWQMVGFFLVWLGHRGKGRALGVGKVRFTGQVTPDTKYVQYRVDIKRVMHRGLVMATADGTVSADDTLIYSAQDLRVGLFSDNS